MNEEERAGWLARAVDKLIQRQPADRPPESPDSQDLDDLLQIAMTRLDLAESTARQGSHHEASVWHKVLGRLESRESSVPPMPASPMSLLPQAPIEAAGSDVSEHELQELEQVAALRHHMSARMMALAELHREAVWQEVQARLAARKSWKGLFAFFRSVPRHTTVVAPHLDGLAAGQTLWQSADSHTDELIELARKRRVLGLMAQRASSRAERRIWSRLAEAGQAAHRAVILPRVWPGLGWQRLAVGAATLALVIAALGPIPATGLAEHPFARFIEAVGDHVGVAESGPPPVDADAPALVEGTPVTTAEASYLLGVPVSESVDVPAGYHLTASLYYPSGLTGSSGTFLRSYMSGNTALLLFQEAASASDLAVAEGAARDLTLPDGTPATYVTGSWIPGSSGFSWTAAVGQTLVFDRSGVRTVIQFIGDDAAAPDLTAIAGGLR